MEICEDKAYRAYLLRCWQDEPTAWRFSVEEVRAKSRRRGLRDLEELIAFLRAELVERKESDAVKRGLPSPSGKQLGERRHE
jgi:hypothetical protein